MSLVRRVRPEPQATGITAYVGADELLLALALLLVTIGLWSRVGAAALVAPGLVLLWIALPSRRSFLVAPSAPEGSGKGRA